MYFLHTCWTRVLGIGSEKNCVRNLSTTSVGASSHPHCQLSVSSQGGDAGDRISDSLTDTLVQICLSREGDMTGGHNAAVLV